MDAFYFMLVAIGINVVLIVYYLEKVLKELREIRNYLTKK